MTFHKITSNTVERTIAKHLTPKEEFPMKCVGKYGDYLVQITKALIKKNGKNCGIRYQFVVYEKDRHRESILGTLYLLDTRYKSYRGIDFAWKNGDCDLALVSNFVNADTYYKDMLKVAHPRPNTSWGDLPLIGPNIARDLASQQGEYDEVNANYEHLDYDWYFESAEEMGE